MRPHWLRAHAGQRVFVLRTSLNTHSNIIFTEHAGGNCTTCTKLILRLFIVCFFSGMLILIPFHISVFCNFI